MTRILAVDDEELVLNILKAILSPCYDVVTAQGGALALEILHAGHFDLVITDLRMDPMNGLDLLRKIRETHADLPVIMLTAYASAETAHDAQRLGAFAYLTKPFTSEEVLETIQRALAGSAKAAPPTASAIPVEQPPPGLSEVVQEYMTRAKLPNPFEAKIELADELYWLSQDHTKNSLLKALNDAVGWNYVQMEVIDGLLDFRQTMVRAKQILAHSAQEIRTDATALLKDIAKKAADAHIRNKGDDLKTAEQICEFLHVAHGTLGSAEIKFLTEYYDANLRMNDTLRPVPAAPPLPLPSDPLPPPRNTRIRAVLVAMGSKETGGARPEEGAAQIIHKLRHQPVLSSSALQEVLHQAAQKLGGRTGAEYRKVERVVDAHISLNDMSEFYSSTELADLRKQGVPEAALLELMKRLNQMADSRDVRHLLKRIIPSSAWPDALTSFASRYFRRRFNTAWATDPSSSTPE